jgi:hypothetical protein
LHTLLLNGHVVTLLSSICFLGGANGLPFSMCRFAMADAEYRIVQGIPRSAVMAQLVGSRWQFVGQKASFTALSDGPLSFALNATDFRNYKGCFDTVVEVPES